MTTTLYLIIVSLLLIGFELLQYIKFRRECSGNAFVCVLKELVFDLIFALLIFDIIVCVYALATNQSLETIFNWFKDLIR